MGLAYSLGTRYGGALGKGIVPRTHYTASGGSSGSNGRSLGRTTPTWGMSHLLKGRGVAAAAPGDPSTATSATAPSAALAKPSTPKELTRHLAALLTRHGSRGEWMVAEVQRRLVARYRHPHPIGAAIEAVKPVIKYYKSKSSKAYIPLALYPRTAEAMAMRWLIQAARAKTYVGDRPDIVRGLVDEIETILQGTSALFRKRFDTHRNPN